ncbi:MAG TPA: TlpA disulfide reductase family protein [Nocardioides sp.]|uniref:TlpA family protein disulfide reductase n=1 Tax=Nocardioides sp. TaxID=35761 RepID=UPI002F40A494
MRTRLLSLLAVALLLLTASGCSSLHGLQASGDKGYVAGDGSIRTIAVGDRGKPVTLSGTDLEGKPISLASMRGKPTVVNVWGSWCADCHREQPLVVAAARKLGDQAHFVGIDSRDNGTAQAKSYNRRYGITWPSFFSPGGEALLAFPGVIGPNSIPSTVILDAQGRPAAAINGGVPSTLTLVQMVQDVARDG